MGHLTLISEDVISALEHYPPELRLILAQFAPQPGWDDYVSGRYHETKKKDTSLLGGGKPVVTGNASRGAPRWKVDEADSGSGPPASTDGDPADTGVNEEMTSEFRRTNRPTRESSADFGVALPMQEESTDAGGPPHVSLVRGESETLSSQCVPQFARYLAQEISSSAASSSDGSDDEDEDGGWLAQSKFDLGPPPVSARNHNNGRRPLSPSGFDVSVHHFVPIRF